MWPLSEKLEIHCQTTSVSAAYATPLLSGGASEQPGVKAGAAKAHPQSPRRRKREREGERDRKRERQRDRERERKREREVDSERHTDRASAMPFYSRAPAMPSAVGSVGRRVGLGTLTTARHIRMCPVVCAYRSLRQTFTCCRAPSERGRPSL